MTSEIKYPHDLKLLNDDREFCSLITENMLKAIKLLNKIVDDFYESPEYAEWVPNKIDVSIESLAEDPDTGKQDENNKLLNISSGEISLIFWEEEGIVDHHLALEKAVNTSDEDDGWHSNNLEKWVVNVEQIIGASEIVDRGMYDEPLEGVEDYVE
ncbi:MAG: hypothetical protein HOE83_19890 [Alphaproteobacteria bacterium]|jgi:hypothetical protein|nr:hypothetical protein [Alphaproteobacteria bacterium]